METLRLREDGLHWLNSDSGIVALELESSVYLSTNPSGALLWTKLSNGATTDELVTHLVDEFGISQETAQADVESFLASLRAQNLLAT